MLGIGNLDRGDDAAGRAVVGLLRRTLPADVAVVEHDGEATTLIAYFERVTDAFIVDACSSGGAAGTIRRIDASTGPLPNGAFGVSTHGFGLGQAIELARALGELPPRCVVYAIEGGSFETGAPMSNAVNAAVGTVAQRVRGEIYDAGSDACSVESGEETRHA